MELDSLSMVADSISVAANNTLKFVQYLPEARQLSVGMFGCPDLASSLGGITIAIVAIFGVFFVPFIAIVSIVWFVFNHKQKESKLRADLMTKAIEHGQTIPNNLFETKEKKSPLKKGIIWTAVGLGISLFFLMRSILDPELSDEMGNTAIGIIPLFVGIGYLLIHFLDKK